jgi:TRAP-type mannitol/chloroaromatic compound transport system permease small subunit
VAGIADHAPASRAERLLRAIDRLEEAICRASSVLILLLVGSLTYEVVMRYLLGAPTQWSFDLSYMLTSLALVLAMGHVLQLNEHVRVDLLLHHLSPRVAATIEAILYLLLFFPFIWVLFLVLPPHVANSWRMGERYTAGTWLPPIYPFKTWITIGMALLALQGAVQFLRALRRACGASER